jgi:twinkle protein
VPENEGHLREKLAKIWQNDKSFDKFASEYFFIQSAVPEFNPKDAKSLWWVLKRAEVAVNDFGCNIVLIDPWNELDRARGRDESVTDYIGNSLMMVKDFCRSLDATVIIVAHPTKAINENGGRVPGLYDVEGSANWANKCDNGLVVWRDMENGGTKVISNKVREAPDAGIIGAALFHVDPLTGIFTPQLGAGYEP